VQTASESQGTQRFPRTEDGKLNLVGERVRQCRKARKWTRNDFIAELGRVSGGHWTPSEWSIARLEARKQVVPDHQLLLLSRCLGVSVEYLLTGQRGLPGGRRDATHPGT
jgi:transcriptional regulator with XRE-family HTH domain